MNATTARPRRLLAAALLAGSVVLAGCSNASPTTGAETGAAASSRAAADGRHNTADVTFAQDMVVHHRGAIEMAELAATRAQSPAVRELAARIQAAQEPEIEQLTSWLATWGEEAPMQDAAGMDHHSMPGSMTEEDLGELEAAAGAEFDRMFLQLMTAHHEGAVEMARTEQAEGADPQAVDLATRIEESQTAEIAEMAQLLEQL